MPDTSSVSATQFVRDFARYRDEAAHSDVIVITSHDRVIGGYLSARELEHYRKLKAREREILKVGELHDDILAAIESAEYGAEPR